MQIFFYYFCVPQKNRKLQSRQIHSIKIKNAHLHNLKNIDVEIPHNKLITITGVSGSGKSTLAMDTLYAEGQRRYVESLSSYARQFLGRMNKPEVDEISGIAPAIAIQQRVSTKNPRSTVGTITEVYEFLKLLYARLGKTFSPVSGKEVTRHSVSDVVKFMLLLPEGAVVFIYSRLEAKKSIQGKERLKLLIQQGFSRIFFNGKIQRISKVLEGDEKISFPISLLIDRVLVNHNNEASLRSRFADSVETAFFEGRNTCYLEVELPNGKKESYHFSNAFEMDGITFIKPSVNFFSFNNPYGACPNCEGYGKEINISEDLVIPNMGLSVYEDAVACWKGEKMSKWKHRLLQHASKFNFPVHRPYYKLTESEKQLLWEGNQYFGGIYDFFQMLQRKTYKIQYRVMLARYKGKTTCHVCKGTRLRKETNYVKINGKSISDLVKMQIEDLFDLLKTFSFDKHETQIANPIMIEILRRLLFIKDVGLGYLDLNRGIDTLSGGESQRINISRSLGSGLVSSMYILDEPSIGLHPRDTYRLIKVLDQLKKIGNTVIVVEHDEDMIRASDHIIDIGPKAGKNGGEIVFQGNIRALAKSQSLTGQYISGRLKVEAPEKKGKFKNFIEILNAHTNNLKGISVKFPLNMLTVVTGVSGSGKTTLVKDVLYKNLRMFLDASAEQADGSFYNLGGDLQLIKRVELIDQSSMGRSLRSNALTYTKAFDDIRHLFANQPLAKKRAYTPGFFSFNSSGGRCETCQGEGKIKIEMQFMADIILQCEVCKGKRYKDELLEIKYREKNISDILHITVDEALVFFKHEKMNSYEKKIIEKLKPLADVGLGYLQLGQTTSSMSGGEAQRLKLASFLFKGESNEPCVFVFDEPTTGLHMFDIQNLLNAFYLLLKNNHSVIVIEHNLEIIKEAGWLIDLGPEGGKNGGEIIFQGLPENIVKEKKSHTGEYLSRKEF